MLKEGLSRERALVFLMNDKRVGVKTHTNVLQLNNNRWWLIESRCKQYNRLG